MNPEDYDANNDLEILPGADGEGFIVFLFDRKIGEGATVEAALGNAKRAIVRWVEECE